MHGSWLVSRGQERALAVGLLLSQWFIVLGFLISGWGHHSFLVTGREAGMMITGAALEAILLSDRHRKTLLDVANACSLI